MEKLAHHHISISYVYVCVCIHVRTSASYVYAYLYKDMISYINITNRQCAKCVVHTHAAIYLCASEMAANALYMCESECQFQCFVDHIYRDFYGTRYLRILMNLYMHCAQYTKTCARAPPPRRPQHYYLKLVFIILLSL